jgi:F-type H+-transporting ATPase subunit b
MPQFDPSSFPAQIFWLVVSFIALYWLVTKVAVPRVGEVLEQRARVIQEDLDRATQLKAETDAAAAAYEKAMADARHQAQEHMSTMQADMKAVAEKRTADISAQIGKQVSDAETRIGAAKTAAMEAMRGIAADTARDVVAKLAAVTPDAGAVDAAVAAALKETR